MKLNKDNKRRFKNIKDSQSMRVVRALSCAQSLHIAVKEQSLHWYQVWSCQALIHLWLLSIPNPWSSVANQCSQFMPPSNPLTWTVHFKLNPKLLVPTDPKYFFTDLCILDCPSPHTNHILHHPSCCPIYSKALITCFVFFNFRLICLKHGLCAKQGSF